MHNVDYYVEKFIQEFPEHSETLQEHLDFNGEFLGHIFFGDAINIPLTQLLSTNVDKIKIRKYISLIEDMYEQGDEYVKNIVIVTILEYIGDDKKNLNTAYTYMTKELVKMSIEVEQYLGRL